MMAISIVSAPHHRLIIIPAWIITKGESRCRQLSASTSSSAASSPTTTTAILASVRSSGNQSDVSPSASVAPEVIPSVIGSASGLRSARCINQPQSPSVAPPIIAIPCRGSHMLCRIIAVGWRLLAYSSARRPPSRSTSLPASNSAASHSSVMSPHERRRE